MKILGIETSCDETGVSVVDDGRIVTNLLYSQEALHRPTGGIIPEVAARAHLKKIYQLLKRIDLNSIDLIAVTVGPGLIGSLLVGVETARVISAARNIPVIAVNHLEGHIFSALAEEVTSHQPARNAPANISEVVAGAGGSLVTSYFPMLSLIVSGGHTELVLVEKVGSYQIVGETVDDAAGEAFDKIARLLGLGYPGGPAIARAAQSIPNPLSSIVLPRPMINSGDFNFSFAGLKTSVLYQVRVLPRLTPALRSAFAHETEQAIIEVLVKKTLAAARQFRPKTITIGGGVAANRALREAMATAVASTSIGYLEPNLPLATDNAAMIALAGYLLAEYAPERIVDWRLLEADPGLRLD